MNASAPQLAVDMAANAAANQLKALLRLGLLEFWQRSLPQADRGLSTLLADEVEGLGLAPDDWPAARDAALAQWPPSEGPLAQLVGDFQLSLPQALLVALLGETEDAHLVNLLLSALQAPEQSARPRLHFCVALIEELFPGQPLTALDLAQSPLVEAGIVQLHGEGPLPLRSLSIAPVFWSLLTRRPVIWPGCRLLAGEAERVDETQLQSLSALLAAKPAGGARALVLRGQPQSGRGAMAAALSRALGMTALEVPVDTWQRHPELPLACRYAGWLPVLRPLLAPGEVWRLSAQGEHPRLVILGSEGAIEAENLLEVRLGLPVEGDREARWQQCIQQPDLAAALSSALLSHEHIRRTAEVARCLAQSEDQALSLSHIARARRQFAAEKLRLLAEPVDRQVGRDALVIPALVASELDRLVLRARSRESLWQGLGATLAVSPNSGVRALFVGESGTGKTLAASYIATELAAPLYRVDLSSVMNKYIGESEKNLAQLLDQAAASDVVLLFDEADSLFGSRSEGRETGERFANMLTNFLLTRIENHPGIVILTSNSQERIDNAFSRRLDMVIEFPLPGHEERLALWRSHLGERGPGDALCKALAAYCNLAGGQLRNAVITAAVLSGKEALSEWAVLEGVKAEYRKLGRELPQQIARRQNKPRS